MYRIEFANDVKYTKSFLVAFFYVLTFLKRQVPAGHVIFISKI